MLTSAKDKKNILSSYQH